MPPLKMLWLKLRQGDEDQPMVLQSIIDSLALIPSLSSFHIHWTSRGDVGPLLRELTRMNGSSEPNASHFTLLPSLERLGISIAYADAPQLIDVISNRWRSHGRTLESVAHCRSSRSRGKDLNSPCLT